MFSHTIHYFDEKHVEMEQGWKGQGRGLLTVRQPKDAGQGKASAHVVFTTEAGRVLLNAALHKGISLTVRAIIVYWCCRT